MRAYRLNNRQPTSRLAELLQKIRCLQGKPDSSTDPYLTRYVFTSTWRPLLLFLRSPDTVTDGERHVISFDIV
jgi:hypothetical protein